MPETQRNPFIAAGSIAVVIAAAVGTAVLFVREHGAQARQAEALRKDLAEGPVIRVARIELAPADRVVSLPAEVRPEQRATLYAKVSGYVKKVLVERGDRVRKGQVLATLESPDLEAQVASAQAELTFRRQQLARVERLAPSGRVSVQEREAAQEGVEVARAALARAQVQVDYQVLRAPFDGTVTARFADPGRSEEHTSELQSRLHLVCRLLLEKKKGQPDYATRGQLRAEGTRVHDGPCRAL